MLTLKPLHIIVPGEVCNDPCLFCATRRYEVPTTACFDKGSPLYLICQQDYLKRLSFARDAGYNALFIRGNCEPQRNRLFLEQIAILNRRLSRPFNLLELFTCGYDITREYLYFLRSEIGMTNVSLEIASFASSGNAQYMGEVHPKINLYDNVKLLHDLRFLITVQLYSTKEFDEYKDKPDELFKDVQKLFGAKRVFLNNISNVRYLAKHSWLRDKVASQETVDTVYEYVTTYGKLVEKRKDGTVAYSLDSVTVLLPSTYHNLDDVKNLLILWPDTYLYSKWNDKGSLVF